MCDTLTLLQIASVFHTSLSPFISLLQHFFVFLSLFRPVFVTWHYLPGGNLFFMISQASSRGLVSLHFVTAVHLTAVTFLVLDTIGTIGKDWEKELV